MQGCTWVAGGVGSASIVRFLLGGAPGLITPCSCINWGLTVGATISRTFTLDDETGFVGSCEARKGELNEATGPAAKICCCLGWAVPEGPEADVAERTCCLVACSHACCLCFPTDLWERGICQFEEETLILPSGWSPDNRSCVKGGEIGRFGCRECCNTGQGPPTWDSCPREEYWGYIQKNWAQKHTCTRVVWLKKGPDGRFSSCTNSCRCRHGEAWRSLSRVVLLDAHALDCMHSTYPGVGVGVTGCDAGRWRRGLSSMFWVFKQCACRALSWICWGVLRIFSDLRNIKCQ